MKKLLLLSVLLILANNSHLFSQDYMEMNKKNLRIEHQQKLNQIDSLNRVLNLTVSRNNNLQSDLNNVKNEIIRKSDSLRNLSFEMSQLELNLNNSESKLIQRDNLIDSLRLSISDISAQNNNLFIQDSLKKIILENEIKISKLSEKITSLELSISGAQSNNNDSTPTTFNRNDFLNKYYFDQFPLENNSFRLVLSKVIFGTTKIADSYNNDYREGVVSRLPEVLEPNAFGYYGVQTYAPILENTKFNDYVSIRGSDFFDSKLPTIEILKNKLFTLKYKNGTEESFLFNVTQLESKTYNNERKTLQIELAEEANNTKNIVWKFFAIDNECYLALSKEQLRRLNVKLLAWGDGLEVEDYRNPEKNSTMLKTDRYNNYTYTKYDSQKYRTTGEGIYISRKKDIFMDGGFYVEPENLVYLFKLK